MTIEYGRTSSRRASFARAVRNVAIAIALLVALIIAVVLMILIKQHRAEQRREFWLAGHKTTDISQITITGQRITAVLKDAKTLRYLKPLFLHGQETVDGGMPFDAIFLFADGESIRVELMVAKDGFTVRPPPDQVIGEANPTDVQWLKIKLPQDRPKEVEKLMNFLLGENAEQRLDL